MTAAQAATLTTLQKFHGEFLVDFCGGIAHSPRASELVNPKHVMALLQSGHLTVRDCFHYSVTAQSAQQLGVS